jgi:hypothetical protein
MRLEPLTRWVPASQKLQGSLPVLRLLHRLIGRARPAGTSLIFTDTVHMYTA